MALDLSVSRRTRYGNNSEHQVRLARQSRPRFETEFEEKNRQTSGMAHEWVATERKGGGESQKKLQRGPITARRLPQLARRRRKQGDEERRPDVRCVRAMASENVGTKAARKFSPL